VCWALCVGPDELGCAFSARRRGNGGVAVNGRDFDLPGKKPSRPLVNGRRAESDPYRQTWAEMLAHLRKHYNGMCRQWFDELEPLGIAAGAIEVRSATILHRDYLRKTCADAFNDAARTVSGRLLSVRFLGPADEAASSHESMAALTPAPARPRPVEVAPPESRVTEVKPAESRLNDNRAARMEDPPVELPRLERAIPAEPLPARKSAVMIHDTPNKYETLVVNPDYCFENFVVGHNNRLAHAAAQAVASNPGRAYNPFFVHGGVGLGKTHLLQAVCLRIVEANPNAVLYYTSCEGFVTQFLECVQSGEMAQFRHRFRDVDVLIIDDIHFLTKRDRSQEEFFHTFNSLFQAQKQIILSSDAAPEDIPDLEERLVSRFKWGLVAKIEQPDYETRIEILKTKARLRGMMMPDDVAKFVAERIESNIRELEGAIVKIQLLASVNQQPISIDLAKQAIGERVVQPAGEPTIQSIISVVTEFYGIRLADLQSKHRQRSIALPRHVCMFMARKCTRLSLEEIGGFFGGRDHTTVMHAVKTVEEKLREDSDFPAIITMLEEKARAR
jgi:chromosomal replication initiator protein